MRVIQLQDGFGINHLQLSEQSKPSPAAGEILVKLEAVSINYVDLLVVKGLLNPNLHLPQDLRKDPRLLQQDKLYSDEFLPEAGDLILYA